MLASALKLGGRGRDPFFSSNIPTYSTLVCPGSKFESLFKVFQLMCRYSIHAHLGKSLPASPRSPLHTCGKQCWDRFGLQWHFQGKGLNMFYDYLFLVIVTCHCHHHLIVGGGGAKQVLPSTLPHSQLAPTHSGARSSPPRVAGWWWSSPRKRGVGASGAPCKWSYHCVDFCRCSPPTVSSSQCCTSSEGGHVGCPSPVAQVLALLHLQLATPAKVQPVLPQTPIFDPSDGSQA